MMTMVSEQIVQHTWKSLNTLHEIDNKKQSQGYIWWFLKFGIISQE